MKFSLLSTFLLSAFALPTDRKLRELEANFLEIRNKMAVNNQNGKSDVLLTPRSIMISDNPSPYEQPHENVRKWPGNRIPIQLDPTYNSGQRAKIWKALHKLEESSCFQFPQRITETNYLYFRNEGGCMSFVGMHGGKQDIPMSDMCLGEPTIQHEVFHAIGFEHEHQRIDRDDYVDVIYPNIGPYSAVTFQKLNYRSYGRPYTLSSLMHYRANSEAKYLGLLTMIAKNGGKLSINDNPLSDEDILRLRSIGNCPGADPNWPKTEITSRLSISDSKCADSHINCRHYAADGYCQHPDSAAATQKLCPNSCKPECLKG